MKTSVLVCDRIQAEMPFSPSSIPGCPTGGLRGRWAVRHVSAGCGAVCCVSAGLWGHPPCLCGAVSLWGCPPCLCGAAPRGTACCFAAPASCFPGTTAKPFLQVCQPFLGGTGSNLLHFNLRCPLNDLLRRARLDVCWFGWDVR